MAGIGTPLDSTMVRESKAAGPCTQRRGFAANKCAVADSPVVVGGWVLPLRRELAWTAGAAAMVHGAAWCSMVQHGAVTSPTHLDTLFRHGEPPACVAVLDACPRSEEHTSELQSHVNL